MRKSLKFGPIGLCALLALLANKTNAQTQYFGVTGGIVNGGTYSWDDLDWSVNNGTSSGPFNSPWLGGSDFARFYGGAGLSYTVSVDSDEQNTGMYLDSSATLNLTAGGGSLDVQTTIQGFLSTGNLYIYAPITGVGGVAPELSGSVYMYGDNTYTGGTALGDSGNTLTYFNGPNSFSTGPITLNRTGIANFSTLLSTGGSSITLANNFSITSAAGTGTALNFASGANTPVVSSGTWTLGTYNLNLRNAGGSTAPLTISGAISGAGILALSANGTGSTTILSGANPFTGQVIVTGSGGTYGGSGAITLALGAPNTLANASSLSLAGGTVNAGGFNQAMSGTLGMTASSTLAFGAPANTALSFAASQANTWTGTLNLIDWAGNAVVDGGTSSDTLKFGTSSSGLTSAQLADIEFDGNASTLGTAALDPNGYLLELPEPSTYVLGLVGGLGMLWTVRRRTA